MIEEFKPTIFFLLKFFGLYLIGNLLYGWYVTSWHPQPDPMTQWVTSQSAAVLGLFGYETSVHDYPGKPTTYIEWSGKGIVSVYEGCNGLNVVIVFLSFLFAFGPYKRNLVWFASLGLFIIHVANLARIVLLFLVSIHMPDVLYFTHKYLFTAFIYLFVFLLWIWWVLKFAKPANNGQRR
jgi:exosortase family protein XrtF